MILDARLNNGADRGVLWDLDAKREVPNCCWANLTSGEYVVYVTDAAGRKLYQAQFEDLRTGRKAWVCIGPDPDHAAADRAAPAKGLLRVSRVYPVYRRLKGRLEFIRGITR